jgi:hypothetical protein
MLSFITCTVLGKDFDEDGKILQATKKQIFLKVV